MECDVDTQLKTIARAQRLYLLGPTVFRAAAGEFMDRLTNELIDHAPPEVPANKLRTVAELWGMVLPPIPP